ncbi:hypothetical protein RND81_09G067200 [Saponaria officinalis]|uniref:Uncharacterized protein n=1 Tax=Saponaria officinalis TaxID=3572 RepID=A0AAW1IIF9_SAPOF
MAADDDVSGKLKLKGKALDVKSSEVSERKDEKLEGETAESSLATSKEESNESEKQDREGKGPNFGDHLTPAEKRYIERIEKLDAQNHMKTSKKSHRDRLNDFNQYLANLS